jgi:hypothetical protein
MGLFLKLGALLKQIADGKADLKKREEEFYILQRKADEESHNKLIKLETEISETREKKLSILEDEIAKIKMKRLEEVAKAEQAEREHIHAEIVIERDAWLKELEDSRKQLSVERNEVERQKGAVYAQQSEIQKHKTELESTEKILEREEERLENQWQRKYDELDDKLKDLLEEERESLEEQRQSDKNEIARLRDSLRIQTDLAGALEQLKRQLGGKDPAVVIRELNSKTDELKRLNDELATCPTEEMRERYKILEAETAHQKALADERKKQIDANRDDIAEVDNLRLKNSELEANNRILEQRASRFEGEANEANAELKRLRAAYERPAEVEARYKEIEKPWDDKVQRPPEYKKQEPKNEDEAKEINKKNVIAEIDWLEGIRRKCEEYGMPFNSRILYAFHTALKTAEWSPLTILDGVSGTGKSKLPELYSHFGGLYFEPLSVQPNWDSQESMLGFFNSIDNKFDAQPVLHLLAQSQKDWEESYPGLKDAVCLILLDEMNIANPDLYFAEFLSKLELRRGKKGSKVPSLPVKIGAGMPHYPLPLGRNVLWTGTMNHDETTKSLSDKVLDRSIIIHFPRPTELKRRLKLEALDEKNRGQILHKAAWQSWLAQKSLFSEDEVKPFKEYIEEMNEHLAVVGRAIGHRVWQSIEYYMANYPEVRAAKNGDTNSKLDDAMHKAFEDQLVQKVMPKLRGIDTRGKSKTDCLDKILGLITDGIGGIKFELDYDFKLACELGHGQFMWQTANYIKDDSTADKPKEETNKSEGEMQEHSK